MNEQTEASDRSGPRPAHPYGPGLPPYPGRPYGPPQDEAEVTIKLVDNGWIVTAPGADDDTYLPDDQVQVFQFSQKPELLAFVDKVTPGREEGE